MLCITHPVVLHAYIKRSQILLTLRNQVMCSVYFALSHCVEVAYKGLSLIQQQSKEQCQVFNHSQHCFGLKVKK